MKAATRPVGVDELKRAYAAVLAGDFRRHAASPRAGATTRRSPGQGGVTWHWVEPVLPVLGAAGSVGATTLALALAQAAGGGRVVECSSVTTSGLGGAPTAEHGQDPDGWVLGTRGAVAIDRPGQVLLTPDEVPTPRARDSAAALTVLDVGWEAGQVLAGSSWIADQLRRAPDVVVVTTATVPGLRRLECALSLLNRPAAVVVAVLGPRRKKWPRQVQHCAGALTKDLDAAGRLVVVPADPGLHVRGLDSTELPAGLLSAAGHLLGLTRAGNPQKGPTS